MSFPVLPDTELGGCRQRVHSGSVWFQLFAAIYIPITLMIKYCQCTILIGSLELLTVCVLRVISREHGESCGLDVLVARDLLRGRGRLFQTQLGCGEKHVAGEQKQPSMSASEAAASYEAMAPSPLRSLRPQMAVPGYNFVRLVSSAVLPRATSAVTHCLRLLRHSIFGGPSD
jgi:hypothetical protein